MTIITIKQSKLDPMSQDNDATLQSLATSAVIRGARVTPKGFNVEYEFDGSLLPLAIVDAIKYKIESISDYPTFIEIASEDEEVPLTVFEAVYANDEAQEVRHTWNTWKLSNHTFMQLGDRLFLGSNAHTNEYLSLNQLEGVDLVDIQTIKELQAEQVTAV